MGTTVRATTNPTFISWSPDTFMTVERSILDKVEIEPEYQNREGCASNLSEYNVLNARQ